MNREQRLEALLQEIVDCQYEIFNWDFEEDFCEDLVKRIKQELDNKAQG
jgi:hypothetical protein